MTKEELIALGIDDETAQKIVDGYAATHVAKDALAAEQSKVRDLTTQLADRDTQLKDLQKQASGNKELQDQIKALQDQNEQAQAEYTAQLQQKEYDFALTEALRDAKAKNPKAVKALLDSEAIKFENGQLVGLNEQLDALKQSDDYLFVADGLKGSTPPQGGAAPKPTSEMTYSEMMAYLETNPNVQI